MNGLQHALAAGGGHPGSLKGLLTRIRRVLGGPVRRALRRRDERRAIAALESLTDRQLRDLGIRRDEIPLIVAAGAREHRTAPHG